MKKNALMSWTAAALTTMASATAITAGPDSSTGPAVDIRHHDLEVRVLPDRHRLEASDRVSFGADERGTYYFYLGDVFSVTRAELDGRRVKLKRVEIEYPAEPVEPEGVNKERQPEFPHPENRVMYKLPAVTPGDHLLEIHYEGTVYDTLKVPEGSRSGIPSETDGLVDTSGCYLSGWSTGWYPDGRDDFSRFSIRVTTPADFEAVTEGKLARVQRSGGRAVVDWEIAFPTQHITLMAARYTKKERDVDGISLMAYFFASEKELIDTYLDASAQYIELYNGLIGPYPFSKFAVVENFFPTGYGMPSYTLLGRRIVRMPFIVKTSLGHEVAHNWWGNCVYPDYEQGNWCEGLTTFYADYRYEAQKGDSAAAAYRKDILIDYATHVADSTDIPLADFRSRVDEVTGAVGYGKCTMVFYMLMKHVGEEKFYRAMRNFFRRNRFEVVDWEDIEWAVEDVYGGPLDDFFDQWVYRAGAPRLSLRHVELEPGPDGGARWTIRVTLSNEGGYSLFRVPVEISGPTAARRIGVDVTGETVTFDWRSDERPTRLVVDPDNDVFRRLDPVEIPVTIGRALAGEEALIVLPSNAGAGLADAYSELAERLAADENTVVAYDSAITAADLASRAVFVLGGISENGAWNWLDPPDGIRLQRGELVVGGQRYADPGHAAFVAFTNTVDSTQTACAIVGNSGDAVRRAGYKVIYYGKYSYATFADGQKQLTGVIQPPPGPLEYEFEAEAVTGAD
jgi:aminopeptidase N